MTNAEFAFKDEHFNDCCEAVPTARMVGEEKVKGIAPTPRQASKFRMKKGLAYKVGKPIADKQMKEKQDD